MKAIEYYEQYSNRFFKNGEPTSLDEWNNAGIDIFIKFCEETVNICTARSIKRDEAVRAVIREQNDKWNALCRLFSKKHGGVRCPLNENGFRSYWTKHFKEQHSISI